MRAPALTLLASSLLAVACAGGPSTSSSSSAQGSSSSGGSSTGATTSGAGGAAVACSSCDGACVDLASDPRHCGACDTPCGGAHPLCDRGQCVAAPCAVMGPICPNDLLCCGMECCPAWKLCCTLPGHDLPSCVAADAGACPTSCAGCE